MGQSRAATGMYAGRSARERSAERRRRLLAAGLDLIGTEGYAALTVRAVCARAKLTSRFFYESFAGVDELAVAVFDQVVEQATANVLEAIAAAPDEPEALARAAIDTFIREMTDDPRRGRVAFIGALGSERLLERRLETIGAFSSLIAAQAHSTYRPPAAEAALVDLTARLLAGGLAELLITWLEGGIEMSRDQLIDDCVALFIATAETAATIARRRSATDQGRLSRR